jgi:hypothetical protein
MKKCLFIVFLAFVVVMSMSSLAKANGPQGVQGPSQSAVIGGVAGGSGGVGCNYTATQAEIIVKADAGTTRNGTYANLKAEGANRTMSMGRHTIAGSVYFGGGKANAQFGGRR